MFVAKLQNFLVARHYLPHLLCGVYIMHLSTHTWVIVTLYGETLTHLIRLEPTRRLQKKIIRIITFPKFKEYTGPLFKELSISPFDDINNKAITLFMFRYFNNNLPSSFNDFFSLHEQRCSSIITKDHPLTFPKSKHENYQKHSIKYKGVLIWNNLPKSIKRNSDIQFIQEKN